MLILRGSERAEHTVELTEREQKSVVLALNPPAAPSLEAAATIKPTTEAPAPQLAPETAAAAVPTVDVSPAGSNLWKPAGIAAVSLGAAGLIVWGVSSLAADAKLSDCPEDNAEHWCVRTNQKPAPTALQRPFRWSAFWSGLALPVGGGSALLIGASEGSEARQATRLAFTPTGVAVHGKF